MNSKHRKVKFKPRIKLNQNRFMRFGLKKNNDNDFKCLWKKQQPETGN